MFDINQNKCIKLNIIIRYLHYTYWYSKLNIKIYNIISSEVNYLKKRKVNVSITYIKLRKIKYNIPQTVLR